MSFGYGVGDILAISELAIKVYTAYKDAPGDYRHIADEVRSLHIVIKKAAQHFNNPTLSNDSRQEGQEVLQGCQNVLEELDTLIVKYSSLASGGTGKVLQRIKLSAEDIAALRARLTSNITLLTSFIQSCDSHKLDQMQAQLNSVLGLHRTVSRDSIVSFAGSTNTKKAYKQFCKGLFEIGVTAKMIREKEKEIRAIFTATNQGDSTIMDQSHLPELGDSSVVDQSHLPELGDSSSTVDHSQPPELGISSDAEASPVLTMSTENTPGRRFGWARPPVDFLVGPLMLTAAESGDTKRLISALRFVRNMNFADDQTGETALHKAAARGHEEIVQLLWAKGASIEAVNGNKVTPLNLAVTYGHTSTVELLLSKGASTDTKDRSNNTPLHYAAGQGHTSIVELLLSKGASIDAKGGSGDTPLLFAAKYGHTSIVELLLSKGASIDAKGGFGDTLLLFAAQYGHTSIVGLLLSKGASIDPKGGFGDTLLLVAAQYGHTSIVGLLLSKGASIDAKGDFGDTPLHCAARNGHTSTVELLLSKGASTEAKNRDNNTPLDLAKQEHHARVVQLLERKAV